MINNEDSLESQLTRFSYLIYYLYEQKQDWGELGKEAIQSSFVRKICNVPLHQTVTYNHIQDFQEILHNSYERYGFKSLTLEEAQSEWESFAFTYKDRSYTPHQLHELNTVLKEEGSFLAVQGGYYGPEVEMILGEGERRQMGEYTIMNFHKEYIHTPNTITSMAAVIGQKEIFVRDIALEHIYEQKWKPSFYDQAFLSAMSYDPNRYLSERIKKKTLELFGVNSEDDLNTIRPLFINDLKETVLTHECGHAVIQYNLLDEDIATFAEAVKIYGETITNVLLEVLADTAPNYQGMYGPLYNMAKIAETDEKRATRMYFMYLSDTWFFDTSDHYMFDYSECIVAMKCLYLNSDLSVNFERLMQDLSYEASSPTSLWKWAMAEVTQTVSGLNRVLEEKGALNTTIFAAYDLRVSELYPTSSLTSYERKTAIYSELLKESLTDSELCKSIQDYLKTENQRIKQSLIKLNSLNDESLKDFIISNLQAKFS